MQLTRPVAFIDVESTGVDVANDRVISLAIAVLNPDGTEAIHDYLVNPERPIPKEASDIHGITDEHVKNKPTFSWIAQAALKTLSGCDLGGYCLLDFDIPILWEEFFRCGHYWNVEDARVIDVGAIYKIKEARTLAAAAKLYLGREHDQAHNAQADALITKEIFRAQQQHYPDVGAMDIDALAKFCCPEQRCDLAGKIIIGPAGEPVYNIGKAKGVRVVDDKGFGNWMLKNNFPEQTKKVLRSILFGGN